MPAYGRGGRGERKGKERIKKKEEERKGEGEKEKREKEGRSKEEGKSERRVWKVRRKEEGVDEKEKSQKAWRLNFTNSHYGSDLPSVDALINALEAISVSAWRYAGLLNARHAYWTVEMLVNC